MWLGEGKSAGGDPALPSHCRAQQDMRTEDMLTTNTLNQGVHSDRQLIPPARSGRRGVFGNCTSALMCFSTRNK